MLAFEILWQRSASISKWLREALLLVSTRGWKGGGPAMQCHILAMVLAVTLNHKIAIIMVLLLHCNKVLIDMIQSAKSTAIGVLGNVT